MAIKTLTFLALGASTALLAGCASTPDQHSSSGGPGPYGDGSAYNQTAAGSSSDAKAQGLGQYGDRFGGESWGQNGAAANGGALAGQNAGPHAERAKKVVYFGFDQYSVDKVDQNIVQKNINYLLKHPNQRVLLEGYTDPRGSSQYNLNLGQKRANSVKDALLSAGVGPKQVSTLSYGKECLAMPGGTTEADFQKDRRVIFNYNMSSKGCNQG
ncbi:OmpA family protein [Piscirickettsia litoralis]|uniref:Cell envelope biogenesis protein OmpA n=1 Tax=Piscirickettsia litoralis TaxID=1891921 RepID=A0ABX3A4M6_9GAMM|nr:OmpA family protein [Piscirickettsia litoralis]ODN43819.1 cell envelope biogenesis protein OmpA [Piscirickettsia litoralis]